MQSSRFKEAQIHRWLKNAREGNPDDLSKLCAYCYPKILRFMHYRVGKEDAEDLSGEVILKIMRSVHCQKGKFEPWLYRIARNTVIDHFRYTQARPSPSQIEIMPEKLTDEDTEKDTLGVRIDLQAALAQVRDEHREFLIFKFVQGLTNIEITEITGQSANAIRAMQFRALKSMRDIMQSERSYNNEG